MNKNRIAQHIRQTIGKLIPVDPEIERIVSALLERLKNHDDWVRENWMTIKHKKDNIQLDHNRLEKPDHVSIPFRWKSHVKEQINVVLRNHEEERLNFVHNVISGKYVYQVHAADVSNKEYEQWLKENVKRDEYIIRNYWIYFLNEESAMGFKLALM